MVDTFTLVESWGILLISLVVSHTMLILFKPLQLLLNEMFKILNKRFFLVKWIIVILDDGSRSKIKHKVFADEVLFACIESEECLKQKVSDTRKDEIISLPIKFDKPLFAGHVKAH